MHGACAMRVALGWRTVNEMLAFELTPLQARAVDHRGTNVVVEAVPGSGKTRVIAARCAALIAAGASASEILLLTFSRRAVGELRVRLGERLGTGALPDIRTFHGFAARLLAETGTGGHSRRLLTEPAERALFDYVLATTPLVSLPAAVAKSPDFAREASVRVDEIQRAGPAAIDVLATRATPRLRDVIALARAQRDIRDRLAVADYDDLVARAVAIGSQPASEVARTLRERYRHVLVDEFQDTDTLQLALLALFDAEIFAVGDSAQAIYGFRGAARDAMTHARDCLKMQRLRLDESFRCPPEICALAASTMPETVALTSRVATHGTIVFRRAATPHDEAALIGESIASALARGIPETEIAVLLRSAEPLASLVEEALRARSIAVSRAGGENVIDDLVVDATCAALSALARPNDATRWQRLLAHPAFALPPLDVRLALDASTATDLASITALLDAFGGPASEAAMRLAAGLRAAAIFWQGDDIARAAKAFVADSNLLAFAIAGDEDRARRTSGRLTNVFDALIDLRDLHTRLGRTTTSAALFDAFIAGSDAWRAQDEASDDDGGVRILTVHAAKGLEFSFVVIGDAVDGHFPQAWRSDALVSTDDIALARDCGVDLGTRAPEHDLEERSLWYVAVTRAKSELLVTWSEHGLDGSPHGASRFVPLDARTQEAERTSFRGPLVYVRPNDLLDAQPLVAAHPIRPIRTSAMDTWFTCRRQFYYTALLQIGSSTRGYHAKLGTLVHRAIAEFHTVTNDFRTVAEGEHVAWERKLIERAEAVVREPDFEVFESTLETAAALRSARRLLGRYARHLEDSAREPRGGFRVVGIEENVRYTIDDMRFSGRIDRIDERDDASIVLVDVKTGKLKAENTMAKAFPKIAELVDRGALWTKTTPRANPQLALYRHAKPATRELAFVYLARDPKSGPDEDRAHVDRIAFRSDDDAGIATLATIDDVLERTFFEPWRTGALAALEPTRFARSCKLCDFVAVCPGYLEDEE